MGISAMLVFRSLALMAVIAVVCAFPVEQSHTLDDMNMVLGEARGPSEGGYSEGGEGQPPEGGKGQPPSGDTDEQDQQDQPPRGSYGSGFPGGDQSGSGAAVGSGSGAVASGTGGSGTGG